MGLMRTRFRVFAVVAAGALCLAILAVLPAPRVQAGTPPSGFLDTPVTGGLSGPLSLAFLPDGSGRAVIVQQAGAIRAWDGTSLATLHTMTEVNTNGNERGLLGVAVDPDWPTRPYVYVHYTATTVPTYVQVARFRLTEVGGALALDPASKLVLLDNMPDNAWNHNGGTVRFGPDKTLYISVGDDATGGGCLAQDLTVLAGKILRIRVDDSINPSVRSTLAPPDNPWATAPNDNQKLVWAYGLRNPFRFDVHPTTGRMFIGDVGQNLWEEVSVADAGGLNFGWPYWEGNVRFRDPLCPTDAVLPTTTPPVYVYPNPSPGSVIGAAVYTGVAFPNDGSFPPTYEGDFFFTDYYAGFLRALRWDGAAYREVPGVTGQNWGTGYQFAADFVRGPDGALYFVTGGGQLRKIAFVPQTPGPPGTLRATLVNGRDDVRLTWTVPAPELYVDHYEVYRGIAYDPARSGYVKISSDAGLPPGSTSWTDVGAGAAAGAYFYVVLSVGPNGEGSPTPGQVAKFTRTLGPAMVLLSVPLVTASTLVVDQFAGFPWSIARTFIAADPADPWKRHDPSRPFQDFTVLDLDGGAWLNVTAAGDYRVAGSVPCVATIPLRAGWNLIGFPSMTSRTVADATAGLAGPVSVEGYDAGASPYFLRRLPGTASMNPTEAYWIHSPADQTWMIVNDPSPGCG